METFNERIGRMDKSLSELSADVAKIKETLKNFTGAPPLVNAFAAARFTLNDSLNVLELNKELKAIKAALKK